MDGPAVSIMDQTPLTPALDRPHYLAYRRRPVHQPAFPLWCHFLPELLTARFYGSARCMRGMVVGGQEAPGQVEPSGQRRGGGGQQKMKPFPTVDPATQPTGCLLTPLPGECLNHLN